jgi:hypothetical protein
MLKLASVIAILFTTPAATVSTPQQAANAPSASDDSKIVCQYVLGSEPNAQPYQLCQSKAQWDALEAQYAKDANRMVCHYEELPGTKLGAHKICGPQSAWEARQQAAREQTEKIQMQTRAPW